MRSLFLYNSILFLGLPFCDQKGSEKVSLLRGSEPRLRGYSPLRTPKLWSKNPKAKKCRNDCIFLNAFVSFSTLTPSGPKFLYNHTVGADASIAPYTLARPYPGVEESAAGSRQTNLC